MMDSLLFACAVGYLVIAALVVFLMVFGWLRRRKKPATVTVRAGNRVIARFKEGKAPVVHSGVAIQITGTKPKTETK